MPSVTANATANLSANGTSTASGTITWTKPTLPADATITSVRISGRWSWGGKGNITRVTISGVNTSADTAFDIALANSVNPPITITCVGNNKNATGSNFRWTDLIVTYTYSVPVLDPPVITVGTPNTYAISDETGHDQCVCTFSSDLALSQWEARATKSGVTPARGVGLLVESGGALAANTNATLYIENEELTDGDGVYTITVYGQSIDGIWSE